MLMFGKNSIEPKVMHQFHHFYIFIKGLKHALKLSPNLNLREQYLVQYSIFSGSI